MEIRTGDVFIVSESGDDYLGFVPQMTESGIYVVPLRKVDSELLPSQVKICLDGILNGYVAFGEEKKRLNKSAFKEYVATLPMDYSAKISIACVCTENMSHYFYETSFRELMLSEELNKHLRADQKAYLGL